MAYLEADERPYHPAGEQMIEGSIRFEQVGGRWIANNVDSRVLEFVWQCPIFVQPPKRAATAEYLTRTNYALTLGAFEMDYRDGEVRFRVSIPVDQSAPPTAAALRHAVHGCFSIVDHYLPGLLRVIFNDVAPAQAMAEVDPASNAESEADPEDAEEEPPRRPGFFSGRFSEN